jgi:hypothetical protein
VTGANHEDGQFTLHVHTIKNVPLDLEAEVLDAEECTCHVCSEPATLLVAKSDEIGSSIVFCDEDYLLAADGDVASLVRRLAAHHNEPESEMERTAHWLTTGLGHHARIPR